MTDPVPAAFSQSPSSPHFLTYTPRPTPQPAWLWEGYLAPGSITLLTSQWKLGKTTLVAALLHQMKAGGSLAGLPVRAGHALILTEEDKSLWNGRAAHLDIAGHVQVCSRLFQGQPTKEKWLEFIDALLELHRQRPLSLLVIDPLISYLTGHIENISSAMIEFLSTLQRLTSAGIAVLILHHIAKMLRGDGLAARGTGALSGFADILMEMRWFGSPLAPDRRRHLIAWSRYDATPRHRVIELDADRTNYTCLGDLDPDAPDDLHPAVMLVLSSSPDPLTRQQILDHWPRQHPAPKPSTLWRWLDHAVEHGQLRRTGKGSKTQPYRYCLAGPESA